MSFSATYKLIGGITGQDIARLEKKVQAAAVKGLKSAGALLRKYAIRSLRRRKKASSPGSPPSVHSTHPYANLRNIRFYVEGNELTVGPVLFKRPKNQDRLPTNAQEFGGTIHRMRAVPQPGERGYKRPPQPRRRGAGGRFVSSKIATRKLSPAQVAAFRARIKDGTIQRPEPTKKQETIHLAKRPTMALTLQRAMPKIPSMWTATVSE